MSSQVRNLLVTGGAGFIGSNFVHHWLNTSGEGRVVVLDALTYAGNLTSLAAVQGSARYEFVKGDICDEDLARDLLMRYQIDTVVHFAAESHVDRSILGPDEFIRTNVLGTHALLKASKSVWIDAKRVPSHRFHHVSTDEVYGSLCPDDPPFNEHTPYAPNSPYSASKAGSDHLVRAYHETYGLDTCITNCSNNYGPYQYPEKLIPLMIINILLARPLPVYGDGMQVRDWLYVQDHCLAIAVSLTKGRTGQVYNIGGNSEITNIQIVRMLCDLVDEQLQQRENLRAEFPDSPAARSASSQDLIKYVRDRPGHDRRYAIDFRKARDQLGYIPRRNLEDGLRVTLQWFLQNRRWWEPLLSPQYRGWIDRNYSTAHGRG